MLKRNLFDYFTEKLLSFPISLKQVIFSILLDDLKKVIPENILINPDEDNFYTYRPQLTNKGKEELINRRMGFDQNIYSFLECCENNRSLTEISVNKFFTIEEVAKFLIFSTEQGFIVKKFSPKIKAMTGFLAGKYRIGEYFLHSGKINDEQVAEIIEMQKGLIMQGRHIMFATLLLQKEYIEEKDIKNIFLLKAEASKRFFIDINTVSDFPSANMNKNTEADLAMYKEENELLKKKLNQLLAYCMKNKETTGKW